jgi:hypothetical protein
MADEKTNESAETFPEFSNVDDEKFFYTRMSVQRDQVNEIKKHLQIFMGSNDDIETIEHFAIARFENELSEEQFDAFNGIATDAKNTLPGIFKIQLLRVPPFNSLYDGSNSPQQSKNFSIILKIEFDSRESLKEFYNSDLRTTLLQSCAPLLGETGQIISFDYSKGDNLDDDDDFVLFEQVRFLKVNSTASDADVRNLIFDLIAMKIENPALYSFSLRKAPQENQFFDGYTGNQSTQGYSLLLFLKFLTPEGFKSFNEGNAIQRVMEQYRGFFEGFENDAITIDLTTF